MRQLRHQAMRVIIITQGLPAYSLSAVLASHSLRLIHSFAEPNVIPPVLIDLCAVTILHRFSSPSWLEHVAKHVSANLGSKEALDRVVHLQVCHLRTRRHGAGLKRCFQTGQAILLAPSGLGATNNGQKSSIGQFGRRWLLIKTRRRVTEDGGASILSVDC